MLICYFNQNPIFYYFIVGFRYFLWKDQYFEYLMLHHTHKFLKSLQTKVLDFSIFMFFLKFINQPKFLLCPSPPPISLEHY